MDVNLFVWILHLTAVIAQITRQGNVDGKFDVVNQHKRLLTTIVRTTVVEDPVSCVKDCLIHKKCKSINVNLEMKQCELLDASTSENNGLQIKDAPEWTHYDYRPKDPNGICLAYGLKEVCCPDGWVGKYCDIGVQNIPVPTTNVPTLVKPIPETHEITVCVRFNALATTNYYHIFNLYPSNNFIYFGFTEINILEFRFKSPPTITLTDDPLVDGEWHHVCISWYVENDEAHFVTYQAGGPTYHKKSTNVNHLSPFPGRDYKICIGNDMDDEVIDDHNTFLGKIADWNFYTRKLSVDEVIAIFRGEKITKDLAVAWDELKTNDIV